MRRIDDTPWWMLVGSADADARIEYVVIRGDQARADPLNPRHVVSNAGPISEVRLPGWVAQPELDQRKAVPAGTLTEERFDSGVLGGSRQVWTYLPPGYQPGGDRRYPSVYVLDGSIYVERMDVPRVLDRLVDAGAIPPLVAVFVAPENRPDDYAKSRDWLTFMASELVPAIDATYRTTRDAAHRVILGSSLGAVGATRLALAHPDVFGRVAAIAPPAAAVEALDAARVSADRARRWFVLGGRFDALLVDARRLSTRLAKAGESVTYLEVPEGHSRETFRGHLDDALRALLGAESSGS
jgi:enterochelin esterase family protein